MDSIRQASLVLICPLVVRLGAERGCDNQYALPSFTDLARQARHADKA